MHIRVGRDRALSIDGIDRGLVEATKITGGAAAIETIKPEDTSESEATFDGRHVRHVALSLVVHDIGDSDRYDSIAAIGAMAREDRGDVPEQHSMEGPLTDALRIKEVICLSLDPVEDTSESEEVRLTVRLQEVNPLVALLARDAATVKAAAEEEAEQLPPEVAPAEEEERRVETYWGDEF